MCINAVWRSTAATASESDASGTRLNEIVPATKVFWWLTARGVVPRP